MNWLTYHLLPQVAAVVVSLFLAVVTWRNRDSRGSIPLLITLVGVVGWSVAYALQLASLDLADKVFWNNVRFLFVLVSVLGYFSFAARFTSKDRWLRQPIPVLIVVPAAATLAIVFTNGTHEWIRAGATTTTVAGTTVLEYDWGPWFWVHVAYTYVLLGTAVSWIVRFARRNWSIYRDQAIVVVVAAFVPWLLSALYVFGVTTLEYTTFGFSLSAVAFAWAMYRYDLLDLVPIARERVVEEMRDGVIVLDIEDRIVDLNAAALPIIAADRQTEALGADVLDQLVVSSTTCSRALTDGTGTRVGGRRHGIPPTVRPFDEFVGPTGSTRERTASTPAGYPDPEADVRTFVDEAFETVTDLPLEEVFERDPLEACATDVTCFVDGSRRHYVLLVSPLCDDGGQLTGRLVVAEDVTAIKRRERELQSATTALEERTRQLELRNREQAMLIENLPGVVYRCADVETDEAMFVSTGAKTLTGYAARAFESGAVSFRSIVHPEDRETVVQQKRLAVDDETRFDVTYRVVTSDGAQRWVRDIGEGVFAGDDTLEFVEGFIVDVTENKQREQLQVLNRVLRHNIRNEMNVISGRIDLARAEASPETRDHLEVVARAAHRVTRLGTKAREVQGLLDANTAPSIERIDATETIDRAIASLTDDHPDDVRVDRSMPDAIEVYGNELLATAVYELAENAVVHTDGRPARLSITVRPTDDERAELVIEDDGPGIPDAELEALNGRMESPLVHGSGLGLWVVQWIVDAYGTLDISSGPDGTTATIHLRRAGSNSDAADSTPTATTKQIFEPDGGEFEDP